MNDKGRCIIQNAEGELLLYFNNSYFSVVDNGLTLSDDAVKAMFLDVYFPVDTGIYVQYPVAESNDEAVAFPSAERPATKFGGTWTELYDDEAIFFRTKGESESRTNGLQNDAMQKITGIGGANGFGFGQVLSPSGAIYAYASTYSGGSASSRANDYSFAFDSSRSISPNTAKTSDTETRPKNRLVKIWKRTA